MENIISSTLIQHIEEEPSQVQQNTVPLNHINVEVIPPRELQQVKDVFICTDVEILISKSKNSPLSDYISDNSSEYESAGSTKSSSTHSVNEVVNQEMGSEKVATPTLLGNALKAIKNVFSPSEKGKSKPFSASTPTTHNEKASRELLPDKEPSNHSDNLPNGDSKKMDYLDVSALGAKLSSISLEPHNVTDDSFTTVASRIDDSFQSTLTHFDEHNISDPDSNNQTKSDETFIEIPIDLDLNISCNETLGAQDNCLEETLLRRNSSDSSSEVREGDLAKINNSVLENLKNSPIVEGKGIKCSTPITGDESVILINNLMDKSRDLNNETILVEKILEENQTGGIVSTEREIDNEMVPVAEENKTFEIKNETFNVESANEKTFNVDERIGENVLNVGNKTFELEAKEFIKEIEEKAINLEKSISESFGDAIDKEEIIQEKTFNVDEGVVNDQTFDLGDGKRQEGSELNLTKPVEKSISDKTFSLGNETDSAGESSMPTEKTFNLDIEKKLEEVHEPEICGENEKSENMEFGIENFLASKSEIITVEIKGMTPEDMFNLVSGRVKEESSEGILENSGTGNISQSFLNALQLERTFNLDEKNDFESEKVSSEAVDSESSNENEPISFEIVEEISETEKVGLDSQVSEISTENINSSEKNESESLNSEKVEVEPFVPEIATQNVPNNIQLDDENNLGDSQDPEKVDFESIVNETSAQKVPSEAEVAEEPPKAQKITPVFEIPSQTLTNGPESAEKFQNAEEMSKILAETENVELKPSVPEISIEDLLNSLEKINLSDKNEVESLEPEKSRFDIVEKSPSSENNEKFVEPGKIELEPSVPEILTQNSPERLETDINLGGENKLERVEQEKVNFEFIEPEISAQNLPNGLESVEDVLSSQEEASEADLMPETSTQNFEENKLESSQPEKIDVEVIAPEISAQNLLDRLKSAEESLNLQRKALAEHEEVDFESENCERNNLESVESEKINDEFITPENLTRDLPNGFELVGESLNSQEKATDKAEPDFKANVPEIPIRNFEKNKVESVEPEKINCEAVVPEVLDQKVPDGIEKSPEKIPGVNVKPFSPEIPAPNQPNEFVIEENVPSPEEKSPELERVYLESPTAPSKNLSIIEEENSFIASPNIENYEPEKMAKCLMPEILPKNDSQKSISTKDEGAEMFFECESPEKITNFNDISPNSNEVNKSKHPEGTEIKPDESIKTESDNSKSVIDSPYDFLNKSRNIFHSLSNTPNKKYDSENEDLITGMENLKLDDSLKLDNEDFFGKIENNSLLEDKLSSPSDKTESDTDLAQLIQEQFTANDIEKICSVVDEIPMVTLNRQIMRASQLFEKSFHEKFLDEDELNIQNSLSPEGLDFLDSIQSKSSGRDFSRESLYVKFDPLVEKKEEKTEILLNITPPRQPVNVVAPLNRENTSRVKELQEEIKRLTQLYLDRETANNEKINDYENQIAKLTGQACILENKLRESAEREKALVRKLKEQNKNINDLQVVMEQHMIVIMKLTSELEETKRKNKEEQDVLIAERDSYMTHLQNTEAAFSDVHTKYEKSKKTIECYKKNEIMYKNTLSEQSQSIEDYKEKAIEVKEKAVRELNKIHNEMDELKTNHAQEASRVRAQLRKTELKVQALQESLDQKVKENTVLTSIVDDLIAGKK